MSDNPLDRIPSFDRVSIRAVVVPDGVDPGPALAQTGITDPIALAVWFGDDAPDVSFGDGITPNLTAVLVLDQPEDGQYSASDREHGSPDRAVNKDDDGADGAPSPRPASAGPPSAAPAAVNLPAAYGLQSLAPVRGFGQIARPSRATPPRPDQSGLSDASSGAQG